MTLQAPDRRCFLTMAVSALAMPQNRAHAETLRLYFERVAGAEAMPKGVSLFTIRLHGGEAVGRAFWLDVGKTAYVTRAFNREAFESFSGAESLMQFGPNTCLAVAANFVSGDYARPETLAPVGISYEHGQHAGGHFQDKRGLVLIAPSGQIEIGNSARLPLLLLKDRIAHERLSAFQQIHVIDNGMPNPSLQAGPATYQRRFLVKRVSNADPASFHFGIIHFDKGMTLTQARDLLATPTPTHHIAEAVYLDMGPNNLSWGCYKTSVGGLRAFGDTPAPDFRRYTNFLLLRHTVI